MATLADQDYALKLGQTIGDAEETLGFAALTLAGSNTGVFDAMAFREKTFYLKNTSDRAIDVQVQGSYKRDFSEAFNVGSVITLAVGNVTTQRALAVLTDFHRNLRVNAKAQGSDATLGSLVIHVSAQKGAG